MRLPLYMWSIVDQNACVVHDGISIITLSVSGLNAPTERHCQSGSKNKTPLYACCLQETHFKDTCRLKEMVEKNTP